MFVNGVNKHDDLLCDSGSQSLFLLKQHLYSERENSCYNVAIDLDFCYWVKVIQSSGQQCI